jgi:hypothetical protein
VSATNVVPGGYDVEMAIALDAVARRSRDGFDFQVNDDGMGTA